MSAPGNTCEIRVGRLMEIRVAAGYKSVDDVDQMISSIGRQIAALPPTVRVVVAADWTGVSVMQPDTAARATAMLSGTNPRIFKSAILTVPDHATTTLQVVRIVREAQHTSRKHVTTPAAMIAWLDDVLTHAEALRLREFLRV